MSEGALREALDLGHSLPRLDSSFTPERTLAAAKEVKRKLGDGQMGAAPARYDLDSLHRRVRAAWRSGRGARDLGALDLRRLPWVLCYSPDRGPADTAWESRPWLAEDRRLLREYGQWLSRNGRPRAVRTLLHVFLRDYPVRLETFENLRSILKKEVFRREESSLSDWTRRCRRNDLLEKNGSKSFIGKAIDMEGAVETSVNDVLVAAGFDGPLERSAFVREGLHRYLSGAEEVSKLVLEAGETRKLERLLALLQCEDDLRFRERATRKAIAESLLEPISTEVDAPAPAVKEALQRFFLRCYGDPRLPSGRPNWSVAREKVRRVVIRWLNEQSIDLFFRVVEDTALDSHWRYRKAFWRTCFDDHLIDDVWFVLGSRARDHLKHVSQDDDAAETTATLTGAASAQSVLLMRMANGVTVAEWSHNGACRMWLRGSTDAPEMYKPDYARSDVLHGQDHRQRHYGSDVGAWQRALADWLYQNTGLRIDRSGFPGTFTGVPAKGW